MQKRPGTLLLVGKLDSAKPCYSLYVDMLVPECNLVPSSRVVVLSL